MSLGWASAQTTTWEAWLYNSEKGQITHIDGNGYILDQIQLPLPSRYLRYSSNAQVSASGERAVYIASDTIHDQHKLMVYHLNARRILLEYPLPPRFSDGLDLAPEDSALFNQEETAIAFGFSQQRGGWQIHIIDLQTDVATVILRSGAPNTMNLPTEEGLTPVVRRFADRQITFTLSPASGKGASEGYIWDIPTNTTTPTPRYTALDSDTFAPLNETVFISASGDTQQPNRITIISHNDEPISVYADDSLGFFMPRFIQNGAYILTATYDNRGRITYLLINRQGATRTWETNANAIITALRGTVDGWIYVADTIEPGGGYSTIYAVKAPFSPADSQVIFRSADGTKMRLIGFNDARLWAQPHTPFTAYAERPMLTPTPVINTRISQWSAWIYDDVGVAYRINQDGVVEDTQPFSYPFPTTATNLSPIPSHITASADGRILAGVYKEDGFPHYLDIVDTTTNTSLLTYTLEHDGSTAIPSHSIERAPRNHHFHPNGSVMAFGYGLGNVGWGLVALDIARGVEIGVLRHDSPTMSGLLTETDFGVVPIVQKVTDDSIHFTIQPAGALKTPYSSFVWNIQTGNVNPTLIYPAPQTDSFAPTGEVIMALTDTRLNNTADNFRYGQINALHVYDALTNTRYPFYNAAELWLFPPIFIQNGERILAGGSDASGAFIGWAVLERDGRLSGVVPVANSTWEAAGVGDGFIYIAGDPAPNIPTIEVRLVNTRQQINAGQVVWAAPRQGRAHLVWAGYEAQRTTTIPWAQIAAPILASSGTHSVIESRALAVGGSAIVRTTGDNALLLRANAGQSAAVLTRLSSGTRVIIIGGPIIIEAETWWQIRAPSGIEGWVISQADGIITLVPD